MVKKMNDFFLNILLKKLEINFKYLKSIYLNNVNQF